ncbi:hypothetical protein C8J56DRAFT_827592 [Mycena floridula]|nr:hypothetical protein C8J56DRAFT_827592 [Mycena floridula]
MSVELLILGTGWTSTFLIPLCEEKSISYAGTSRSGANSTIKFEFIPDSDDTEPYKALPDAKTVLITFPINDSGASERLVRLYNSTRQGDLKPSFIQLGATTVWGSAIRGTSKIAENRWYDRHSEIVVGDARANAEQELLALSPEIPATVLNLSGLWGGSRSMRNYVSRVAPTKEVLQNKGSLHMIHGLDVARAILAVHANFNKSIGQRWLLTDNRVYDWWDLASGWGASDGGPQLQPLWVRELMRENNVRALPRNAEVLGRALDSREFWETFDLSPCKTLLDS